MDWDMIKIHDQEVKNVDTDRHERHGSLLSRADEGMMGNLWEL